MYMSDYHNSQNVPQQPGSYSAPYFQPDPKAMERHALRKRGIGVGLALVGMAALPYLLSTVGYLIMMACGFVNTSGFSEDFLYMKPEVYYIYYMVLYLLMVILPYAVLIPIFHLRVGEAFPARRTGNPGRVMLACFAGLAVCMIANYMAMLFCGTMESVFGITDASASMAVGDSLTSKILYFCIFAILPPFAEEFAFRGVVFSLLRPYGKALAVFGSAFIFAIMHGTMVQIPFAFVGGLFFGWLVAETGSIWPSVFLHFLNNTLSVVQQFLMDGLPEQTANHALYFSYLVITAIGLVCLIVLLRKHPQIFRFAEDHQTQLNNREKFRAFSINVGMIFAYVAIGIEVLLSVSFVRLF